jgi:hypothetical protein
MIYEVAQDRIDHHDWRVEAINHDGDGEVYVAIFSGPDAQTRGEAYAAWKNAPQGLSFASRLLPQASEQEPPLGGERNGVS